MANPPRDTGPAGLRATARLQFHAGFTLDDAVPLIPYLAQLGISHLYASPILKARPGSTHGYDIVDHNQLNPELGGEPAFRRLSAALKQHGLGLIIDIVPNHMGVGGSDNAWWLDVLEWGRQSPYAGFFDIDWDPPDRSLSNRMLMPFLGAPYGEALGSGDLKLLFDAADGRLHAQYFEHRFPIAPQHYHHVLQAAQDPTLAALGQEFGRVGLQQRDRALAREQAAALRDRLRRFAETPGGGAALQAALAGFDAGTEAGRSALHRLLERQHYRLAWWRAAADEINWRRFFDITSLAGMRQELPEVFDATHDLILKLYAEGAVDGLRIDHVDGLADPRGYCRKLHRRMQAVRPDRAPMIWVEKILAPFETLRTDWMVDGTTGYDFMDEASGVLHDPEGEGPLTTLWTDQTGRSPSFDEEARAARRQILRDNLASELNGTAAAMKRVAMRDLATRDFTLTGLRRALTEVLVHFPVYRLYITQGGRSAEDNRILDWALAGARRTVRAADRPLIDLLDGWLGGDPPRSLPPVLRRDRLAAAVRFQQLSAPTAAKSVEDTAFYRYGRLISRNEVGSDPARFAVTPAAFHGSARSRAKSFPRALLATATHDHKRGEDVRARLAVLSELHGEWTAAVARWSRLNAPLRKDLPDGPAPGMSAQLMLYQTLVGAWPLGLSPTDEAGVAEFLDRVCAWQEKALREAKRRTEWAVPNLDYEAACRDFVGAMMAPDRASRMREEIAGFAARIAPAAAVNGLSQALLRCTAPGVPDLYQGTEFWDLSLVDPDNRRPVDWEARQAALAQAQPPAELLADWQDGRVKQAVIARALALRTRHPALFAEGDYHPVTVEGPRAQHVLAFLRTRKDAAALVVATRLPGTVLGESPMPLLPGAEWSGTDLRLPPSWEARHWRDALTGEGQHAPGDRLPVGQVLARLPVAVLEVG
ncbi:malto-oligosyltrehalose synthase [Paracraurococcus ruber]|uniref:Malto-oligosyltrehalose synthase n=1 Tax=Paracraurococcus ruber TaxID=77675 RepID=A0ABS1D1B5_9PROT|nr:malto-oligosyltrehalose synthase [Paracraurococcus ruber]MBK1660291.1 malto-oligosyltrehalose synthase [Paracraurococcus ruber]TDG29722.1 malto-oligosyltrehalose synthase [Paracraurococcus ruber]